LIIYVDAGCLENILHFSEKFEKSLKAFKFSKKRAIKHFVTVQ